MIFKSQLPMWQTEEQHQQKMLVSLAPNLMTSYLHGETVFKGLSEEPGLGILDRLHEPK